ncbi:DUF3558 domain-containing protein [Nocardia sp. NPDC050378]|uniref:DUF3558 domain-containing protein n=1 Tax=Nocardia sp. NPDC050378 TaxID=3155400 RepID=UPI0033EF076A
MLCACDSAPSSDPTPTNASPTFAAEVPTGFDPCHDIPAAVFESENLRPDRNPVSNLDAPGGIKWRGCGWGYKNGNGYGTDIRNTNLTVEMIRAKNFTGAEEFVASGRQVIVAHHDASSDYMCNANIALNGGSLDIFVHNPPETSPATGHIPSCTIARTLVEKIMPSVPADA